jgi:hypothetical protein
MCHFFVHLRIHMSMSGPFRPLFSGNSAHSIRLSQLYIRHSPKSIHEIHFTHFTLLHTSARVKRNGPSAIRPFIDAYVTYVTCILTCARVRAHACMRVRARDRVRA